MDIALADVIRWIGTITALLALCATVPTATWGLIHGAEARLRKLFGRSKPVTVNLNAATLRLTANVVGTATVGIKPDATLPERVAFLERRIKELEEVAQKLTGELRDERAERIADVQRLTSHVDAQVGVLKEQLRRQQHEGDRINARALPVAGLGIVLSGFPTELATSVVLGILSCLLGVGLCIWAVLLLVRTRPETEGQADSATSSSP